MTQVVLSFRYNKEDVVRAMRTHYSSVMRPWLDGILAILLFAVGMYCWFTPGLRSCGIFCFGACAVLVLILFVAFALNPYLAFRQQPKYRDDYLLTFSDDGIHFHTANIDSQLQWSLYSRALVNMHSYLLYYGSRTFTIIPTRVFQSEEQRTAFDELLRQNIARIVRKGGASEG